MDFPSTQRFSVLREMEIHEDTRGMAKESERLEKLCMPIEA
jgi:hypothetical protein